MFCKLAPQLENKLIISAGSNRLKATFKFKISNIQICLTGHLSLFGSMVCK